MALRPQSNWDMCPRWRKGIPLACYMLGSSGYNTETLTANHSGAPCRERFHVPRTLKNPAVVFDKSRNHRRLNFPTLPNPWQSKFYRPCCLYVPSLFHFIIIIISCLFHHQFHVHRLNIAEIFPLGRQPQQSINHE